MISEKIKSLDIKKLIFHEQMSESTIVAVLLALGGGFRDAYSYNIRGNVFANAQTGNLVLLSQSLANLNFHAAFKYLLPIIAFMIGIFVTDIIKNKHRRNVYIHWRQIIILVEIAMLFLVGLMPKGMDHWANITISLACAMQVESFRKFMNIPIATTMCTGNMRSATECLAKYYNDRKLGIHNLKDRNKSIYYFFVIFTFCVGAALGALVSNIIGIKSIWIDATLMFVVFIIMFKNTKVN
ncbi:YoaK family protein [Peptostreptococcus sp. D1]|uniref:YoaK family protein n=1 Tax=Peptostreptococcus sp. D1 TaxID=72304 RepID=UPI0008E54F31|nr:YoaK family protein [Peptostreptococcus sp. D1]SFE55338.1 Uncharacterized membrane protein YoaK, UPF0700 family [Peptostreptococcus sp. D1]